MEKIHLTLNDLINRKGWKNFIKERKLFERWEEIAGKEMAAYTKPVKFQKNVLFLGVKDSSWCHHLQFFKGEIISKIKGKVPGISIEDVNFSVITYWKDKEKRSNYEVDDNSWDLEDEKVYLLEEDKKILEETTIEANKLEDKDIASLIKRMTEKDLLLKNKRSKGKMPSCSLCASKVEKNLIKNNICCFCQQKITNVKMAIEKIWDQSPWLSYEDLKDKFPHLNLNVFNYLKENYLTSLKNKILDLYNRDSLTSEEKKSLEKCLGLYIMNKCSSPPHQINENEIKKISEDFPQISLIYFRKEKD